MKNLKIIISFVFLLILFGLLIIKNLYIEIIVLSIISIIYIYLYKNKLTDYKDSIVTSIVSEFQNIIITKNKTTEDIRLYINGNTQLSSLDEDRYHDMLVHVPMHVCNKKEKKKVLILGGGDGLALRELKKYGGEIEEIVLVDIDLDIIKLSYSNEFMKKINHNSFSGSVITNVKEGKIINIKGEKDITTTVIIDDAYNFVDFNKEKKWDVVLIDFPDPSTKELSKLFSIEFFQKIKNLLGEEGVFSIQSTSPYHSKEAFLTIGRTMIEAGLDPLPYRQNIPSFGDWGFYVVSNTMSSDMVSEIIKK